MQATQSSDLATLASLPGYRAILRTVLKSQIKQLVEQLSNLAGEEALLLSASITDGTLSHIGSKSGESFLNTHDQVKSQFLGYCLKRHQQSKNKGFPSPKPPASLSSAKTSKPAESHKDRKSSNTVAAHKDKECDKTQKSSDSVSEKKDVQFDLCPHDAKKLGLNLDGNSDNEGDYMNFLTGINAAVDAGDEEGEGDSDDSADDSGTEYDDDDVDGDTLDNSQEYKSEGSEHDGDEGSDEEPAQKRARHCDDVIIKTEPSDEDTAGGDSGGANTSCGDGNSNTPSDTDFLHSMLLECDPQPAGPTKRKRSGIPAIIKKYVCEMKLENPKLTIKELRERVMEEHDLDVGMSTVNDILHHKERWLAIKESSPMANQKRKRDPKHAILEDALFLWIKEGNDQGMEVTYEQAIDRAKMLGERLGITDFGYSSGWLQRFKARKQLTMKGKLK